MTSYIMQPIFAAPRRTVRIGADATVAELTRDYPDTARLFRVCGIDTEASGAYSMRDVASRHCLELSELLRAVSRAAEVVP